MISTDCYKRPHDWLLASLACHARWLLKENKYHEIGTTEQVLQTLINLDLQQFTHEDAMMLYSVVPETNHQRNRLSFLLGIDWISMSISDLLGLLPDLRKLRQVVVLHYEQANKQWCVFRVSMLGYSIEGYFFGAYDSQYIQTASNKLISALKRKCPNAPFHLYCRLEIPLTFAENIGFASFCFALYIHNQRNYHNLNSDLMLHSALTYYGKFKLHHDRWLGNFKFHKATAASHPFIVTSHNQYDLDELTDYGWCPIDVVADGNCGYYSLILGLENNSNFTYSPVHVDEQHTTMTTSLPWQNQIMRLRETLQKYSVSLISTCYNTEEKIPNWFWVTGADTLELVKDLPSCFVCPRLKTQRYFDPSFKEHKSEFQMNPYFAALVTASYFHMRVVVIARMTGKGHSMTSWSTTTFSYNAPLGNEDHIIHEQAEGIKRISDDDFRRQPTIEILYLGGYTEFDVKHFLFLRRVIRCDASRPPKRNSDSLLTFISDRTRHPEPIVHTNEGFHDDSVESNTESTGNPKQLQHETMTSSISAESSYDDFFASDDDESSHND